MNTKLFIRHVFFILTTLTFVSVLPSDTVKIESRFRKSIKKPAQFYNKYKHLLSAKTGLGLFVGGVIINYMGTQIASKKKRPIRERYHSINYKSTHFGEHIQTLGQYITACGSALFITKIMAKIKSVNRIYLLPETLGYIIAQVIPILINKTINHVYFPTPYSPTIITPLQEFLSKVETKVFYLGMLHALANTVFVVADIAKHHYQSKK